jgi:CheY-like chemotaxis protein
MIPKTAPTKRILVVEDVQETRDAIEGLLTNDGYSVDPARNEDDAVERSRWNRPDLILISLGGSAEELIATAHSMRARGELSPKIPIVIFTMSPLPEGCKKEIGEEIYATQPENFNQVRALLTRLLYGTS